MLSGLEDAVLKVGFEIAKAIGFVGGCIIVSAILKGCLGG